MVSTSKTRRTQFTLGFRLPMYTFVVVMLAKREKDNDKMGGPLTSNMATVPSAATAGPRLGRPPGPSAATLAQQAAKRAAQAASGGSGGSSAASVAGKRGRVDKKLPNKVEAFVPESSLFNQLVQTEKKVDAMLLRKWIEREEATRRPQRTRRTLRVFLSNIVANQPYQQSDNEYEALDQATINEGAPQPPSWTMRIEGRLLEPLATAGTTTAYQLNLATKRAPKFSQLVRKIVVELDRDPSLYPDSNNLIEWIPTVDHQPVDGFEIKRTGDQNVNARVIIDLQHQVKKNKKKKIALLTRPIYKAPTLQGAPTAGQRYRRAQRHAFCCPRRALPVHPSAQTAETRGPQRCHL